MKSLFIQHAKNNIGCDLYQDKQHTFKCHRLTTIDGVLNNFKFMNRSIELPSKGKFYMLFQLGSFNPSVLGLKSKDNTWTKERWFNFGNTINETKIIINLYDSFGLEIPKFNSFYSLTNEGNLIIAIPITNRINTDFSDNNFLYLRVYTAAFYQTQDPYFSSQTATDAVSRGINIYTYCHGAEINTREDVDNFLIEYNNYIRHIGTSSVGHLFCYVNGHYTSYLNDSVIAVGNINSRKAPAVIEFVYDSSVYKVINHNLNDSTPTFRSLKDNQSKYIFMNPTHEDNIDFYDDIDVHILFSKTTVNTNDVITGYYPKTGFYYSNNSISSHRMITHDSYSLPVDTCTAIENKLLSSLESKDIETNNLYPTQEDVITRYSNTTVEIKIRKSGLKRSLIKGHNKIHELYKLTNSGILEAMVGINSNLPLWKAPTLENSDYNKLMTSEFNESIYQLVQNSYGYNFMSKLFLPDPLEISHVPTNTEWVPSTDEDLIERISITLSNDIRAKGNYVARYYYKGKYISSEKIFFRDINIEYLTTLSSKSLVDLENSDNKFYTDIIKGDSNSSKGFVIGNSNFTIDEDILKYDYIVLMSTGSNLSNNEWTNVTNGNQYNITNNRLIRSVGNTSKTFMVRSSNYISEYKKNLRIVKGNVFFTLSEFQDRGLGIREYIMTTLPGDLTLILNGYTLIKDIDYRIVFPEVYFLSKKYFENYEQPTPDVHNFLSRPNKHVSNFSMSGDGNRLVISPGRVDQNTIFIRTYKRNLSSSVPNYTLSETDQLPIIEKDTLYDEVSGSNINDRYLHFRNNHFTLSNDGTMLVVSSRLGDRYRNSNTVSIGGVKYSTGILTTFKRNSLDTEWEKTDQLILPIVNSGGLTFHNSPDRYWSSFNGPLSLSLDKTMLVIRTKGPTKNYIITFIRDNNAWVILDHLEETFTSYPTNNDSRKGSICLSQDKSMLTVGTYTGGNSTSLNGIVKTYKRNSDNTEWTLSDTIIPDSSDTDRIGHFGTDVSISKNNTTLIVTNEKLNIFFYERNKTNDAWLPLNNEILSEIEDVTFSNRGLYQTNDSDFVTIIRDDNLITYNVDLKRIYETQDLTVISSGLPTDDLNLREHREYGFLHNNILSKNNTFDLRDDKPVSIVVDGLFQHRDDVILLEDLKTSTVGSNEVVSNLRKSYEIKDKIVSMNFLTDTDENNVITKKNTYEFKEEAVTNDELVGSYLGHNNRLPEPEVSEIISDISKHKVISPFVSTIVDLLRRDIIEEDDIGTSVPTSSKVIDLCTDYLYLLNYDYLKSTNRDFINNIKIEPTLYSDDLISLSSIKFRFLEKVLEVYDPDSFITLNPFVFDGGY